jgi:hypothetical protein
MAENEQTKTCPLCAEIIKAKARVCPHCRKIQKRGFFFTKYDLIALAVPLLVLGTFLFLFQIFAEGKSFSLSKNKVVVLSSQLMVVDSEYSTNVIAVGVLTNSSNYAWQMLQFEVRFFDEFGKIADVDSGSDGFTVLPHSDHSFRLTLYSRTSIPKHASYKIIVRSAQDQKAWFPTYD